MNTKIKTIAIIAVMITGIVTSAGITYYMKENEIYNINKDHTNEKNTLNSHIRTLENETTVLEEEKAMIEEEKAMIEEEKAMIEEEKEKIEQSKSDMTEDWQDYDKLMTKGLNDYAESLLNRGFAESEYEDAGIFYEDPPMFDWAENYASASSAYYGYSSESFSSAKSYFKHAKEFAPTNKTIELADLYMKTCDLGIQISDEMEDATEHFASACNYYFNERWDDGDIEIDKMNNNLEKHDDIISDFNNYLSDIDSLLDSL